MGERLSIDETSLLDDLFTFLTNKDGHGKKGAMIAAVKGTRSDHVINIIMRLPEKRVRQASTLEHSLQSRSS